MITYPTNPLLYVLTPWTDSVTQTSWKWVVRGESGKWARHGAGENTASILTKLAPGSGGTGTVGPEYLPDALSGAGIPRGTAWPASLDVYVGAYATTRFTAIAPGAGGNTITVTYASPEGLTETTSVTAIGNALTVTPSTRARMTVYGATPGSANATCYFVTTKDYTSNGLPYATNAASAAPHTRIRSNGTDWIISSYSDYANLIYQSAAVGQGSNSSPSGLTFSPPTVGDGFSPSVVAGVSSAGQVIAAVNALGLLVTASALGTVTGPVRARTAQSLTGGGGNILLADFVGQLYQDTTTNTWYRWNGSAWIEDYSSPPVRVSAYAPADTRSLWFETSSAKLHVYYNGQWVATA